MSREAVVVGGGPGALRAAAALAASGRAVTLLQEGPDVGGRGDLDVPIGRGISPAAGTLAERVFGAFHQVEALERAVLLDGRLRALPLSRADVARYVPATRLPTAALSWGRTRGASELRKLIGGGHEQRTYRDWVVQRFGEPVYEQFYKAYCQARFGDPEQVSCNVARRFHGEALDVALYAPASGAEARLEGVDVRTNVAIRAINGAQVETDAGVFTGAVHVDVNPRRVVGWLGGQVAPELINDVGFLGARHRVQVLLCAEAGPFETHVLGGAPFYRVLRYGNLPGYDALSGTISVHYSVEDGDPLLSASVEDVAMRTVDALRAVGIEASPEGARVQVVRDHDPAWNGNHLVRMRRYLLALEDLEITPVGRAGLHAFMDLATEFAWLEGVLAEERPSLRAIYRDVVEPPVLDPEERPHLTRFVER